jgi:antitoxin CcdA
MTSQTCDTHLHQESKKEQERRWREEHAAFIAAYNETLRNEGLPLAEWNHDFDPIPQSRADRH